MMNKIRKLFLLGFIFTSIIVNSQPLIQTDMPVIPVGLDAYRMWDKWPQQRIGARAYMRSTYTRMGVGSDASNFLFANEETFNVTLDVKGKGVFYFFRTNHWHGSPWHFVVDGKDNIVQETSTGDPVTANERKNNIIRGTGKSDPINGKRIFDITGFIPSTAFPEPLNFTWGTTKGADLIWTPIPFKESMRIAYSRTKYGTGYYIYHLYADEKNLSQPIQTWDNTKIPGKDVLDLISRAGTDIAPTSIKKKSGKMKLNNEKLLLTDIKASSSVVRALKLTIPMEKAIDLERLRLQVTWDDAEYPSVDAPLCLFFGAGTFYNRDEKEYLVKAFPVNIRYDYTNKKVELGCYFPMPFFKSAKFELAGIKPDSTQISYEIRYEPLISPANQSSYFHATYKDIPVQELGKDMVFLDTKGAEGQKEWSGSFIGTSFIFTHDGILNTLEADPRFFFDDSQSPQAQGTGTEEWGGGGDYWESGETMTLPFVGHPVGSPGGKARAKNKSDLIQSAYRFLLADMMPFGRRAIIGFEHGDENLSTEHYAAVTYWYGLPAPSLIQTDEIDIGDIISEKVHNYNSPDASAVESISSRYELGPDVFPGKSRWIDIDAIPGYKDLIGKEVYPAHKEDGRFTRGVSEFTVKLDSSNKGAMLRRTLDYSFPNQTAEVYIADACSGQTINNVKWEYAGIWYLAGSNTWLRSNPSGELDARKFDINTSNRRFRDDEFLLPATLTENRSAIWVRIKFVPDNQELLPGTPFPKESAWSELRYTVYSYVLPEFSVKE